MNSTDDDLPEMLSDDEAGLPLSPSRPSDLFSATAAKTKGGGADGGGGDDGLQNHYYTPTPDQVLENVIENVLFFLTDRFDRNAASLVSKSWYRAEALTRSEVFIGNCYSISPSRVISRFKNVKAVVIKGKPRFADFDLLPPIWGAHFGPWVESMMEMYCRCLEKVCLKRMSITDDDLVMLPHGFPNLKELVLICCDGFGTSGLAALACECSQLRVLDLVDSEVADDEQDWISCFPEDTTCLESLGFDCVEAPINFEALEELVMRSPSLMKLRVNRYVSTAQLYRLIVRAPQLTHLGTGSFFPLEDMTQVDQEPNYVSAFAACKSLICLSGFREVLPEYLNAIHPVCANLTSLNLSYASINAEQLKSVIRFCHKLQVLWVLDTICDEGLEAVASTCKDLREIRVFPLEPREEEDGPVGEVGLRAISEGCRKLESILYFCQAMTNAAVIAMSKNCPDLVVFRLCIMGRQRPDRITGQPMDEGFGAIVKNCKKLTRLAVSGLLTDKAFSYIGEHGKLVRTLSVAFAGDSDVGLKYVLEGCPKLQKLEIRDSPFGDAALRAGLHHYYNMRFLWMSSCRVTRQCGAEIAHQLPRLVVEAINWNDEGKESGAYVETLYMYRSLVGPRTEVPKYVNIL